jgi:hypothetical protein
VPKLIEMMSDSDDAIRYWGAMGCCIRPGQASAAVEPLRKLLKDTEPTVRIAAAEALCWQGQSDEAVPVLLEALKLKESFDELQALNSLEALGGERMKPYADAIAAATPKGGGEYVPRAYESLLEVVGKAPPKDPTAAKAGKAAKKAAKKGKTAEQ